MLVLDDMIVMFSSVVSCFEKVFYFDMVYKYKKCLYYAHGLCGCFNVYKMCFMFCFLLSICLMCDVCLLCWVVLGCLSLLCWDCSCQLGDTIIAYSSCIYKECAGRLSKQEIS